MAWLLRSGVYMCTDLYMCTLRVNEGKKHHSRAAFQAGMKQWQSSVPWKYDKLKSLRRIKREAGMYFQLLQSRLEPGTCALIMEWFKHCLALEPHLVLFLFGYKTSAQKVRGMNTEKKKKKIGAKIVNVPLRLHLQWIDVILFVVTRQGSMVTPTSCCHTALGWVDFLGQ